MSDLGSKQDFIICILFAGIHFVNAMPSSETIRSPILTFKLLVIQGFSNEASYPEKNTFRARCVTYPGTVGMPVAPALREAEAEGLQG